MYAARLIEALSFAEIDFVTGGQDSGGSAPVGDTQPPETTTNGETTVLTCPEGYAMVSSTTDGKTAVTCVKMPSKGN